MQLIPTRSAWFRREEIYGKTHSLNFGSTLLEEFVFGFLRVSTQDLDRSIKIDVLCIRMLDVSCRLNTSAEEKSFERTSQSSSRLNLQSVFRVEAGVEYCRVRTGRQTDSDRKLLRVSFRSLVNLESEQRFLRLARP